MLTYLLTEMLLVILVKQAYFGGIWVLTMRKEVIFTKVLQKGLQNNIVLGCFSSSRKSLLTELKTKQLTINNNNETAFSLMYF